MITADELRQIVADEIDNALAPIRQQLARLGNIHAKEENVEAAKQEGARAARIALQRRYEKIKSEHGGESPEPQEREETGPTDPPVDQEDPPAPAPTPRRRIPRAKVRECACGTAMVRVEAGLVCPAGCES